MDNSTTTVEILHSRQGLGITRGEVCECTTERADELIRLGLARTVAKGTKAAPIEPAASTIRKAAPKRQPTETSDSE